MVRVNSKMGRSTFSIGLMFFLAGCGQMANFTSPAEQAMIHTVLAPTPTPSPALSPTPTPTPVPCTSQKDALETQFETLYSAPCVADSDCSEYQVQAANGMAWIGFHSTTGADTSSLQSALDTYVSQCVPATLFMLCDPLLPRALTCQQGVCTGGKGNIFCVR